MTITYRICRNDLADSDDQFVEKYRAAVQAAIEAEYPGEEVAVTAEHDLANLSGVSGAKRNAIEYIARRVLDHLC